MPQRNLDPDNRDMGNLITNISYSIRQYFDRFFAEDEITYPQSRILVCLFSRSEDENINQRDLERALGIKASSVSSLVRNLEQKGFLRCERVPEDARNKRLLLTPRGMELREKLDVARRSAEAQITQGLTEEQQETLQACLVQIFRNFSETE